MTTLITTAETTKHMESGLFSRELEECMNIYLSFHLQMNKKEREICEFKMDLKEIFLMGFLSK